MRTKGGSMKSNILCFCLFTAFLILSLIALSSGTSEGQGTSGLPYDDFHEDTIDRTRWQNLEFIRQIKDGKLEVVNKRYGSAGNNWLEFKDPNEVHSIEAEVTVTEVTADDANVRARIAGFFYNSIYEESEPGNGQEGEVWIQVGIRDTGSGLVAYYGVARCDDADCNALTGFLGGDIGPVNLNEPNTLSVVWNETVNEITFGLDTSFVTTPGPTDPPLPPVRSQPKYPFKAIGARVEPTGGSDSGGYIAATYDDVYRNGSFHDGFGAAMIDYTKWNSWEFVRRVTDGVFESAVARWERNGDNHLNFLDVGAITAFQADVTVKEVINNGASPRARVSGAFYNDGTSGEGYTGDILAGAAIRHEGTQLRAICWVSRCTQPDCNIPGEYENIWWDYLSSDSIQLNETRTLSVAWDVDENKFHFGFDDETVTTDVTLPAVVTTPQGPPNKKIGTRMHGIGDVGVPPFEGEGGYIRAEFDNVVLLTDFLPSYTSGHAPAPGATNVSVDTNIIVHVRDDGTGVDQSTILMKLDDVVVTPSITGDPANYTLTYDPPFDFSNEQAVEVSIEAKDLVGNTMDPFIYSFLIEPAIENPWVPPEEDRDDDEDGIPNNVEQNLLGTELTIKTLFVKPSKPKTTPGYEYWEGFKALLPLTPFTHAGIEIVVIGDPANPYEPMQSYDYDPVTDPNHPPCDILEIRYMGPTTYCSWWEHSRGHTYFESSMPTWYWDTKGYTPNETDAQSHWGKYRYFRPEIYPFPLDNYLTEGAYPSIAVEQTPITTSGCGYDQCYDFEYSSPMNWYKNDPVFGLPDETVEFNEIVFDKDTMEIVYVGSMGIEYDRDTVLRRTMVHEMGHALLGGSNNDHCKDKNCIMYESVADWELYDFGPGNCVHKPGGALDIRAKGVIHNTVHTP